MWCVFFGAIFMFTYITLKLGFDPKNLTEEEIRKDIENAKKYK